MTKTNEEYYCDLIGKLNNGEINFEEYLKERGLSQTGKLPKLYEFKQLINGYPDMLNLFLGNVSIGISCMVMKVVFDLNDRQLEGIIGCSRSTVTDFIKDNLTINIDTNVNSQRNFSQKLTRSLSFIFDLPDKYLSDAEAEYNLINSFVEYERETIDKISLKMIVEKTIEYMVGDFLINRKIYGIRIENTFFNNGDPFLNARVDIRKNFFTVEMHINNDTIIKHQAINKIKSSIKGKCEIYYRNAFMRNNRKLCILISLDDSYVPILAFLNENMLIDNLVFCDDWKIGREDKNAELKN
ncbi:hypothetical protein [Psychrobacillus sp. L3]|uniref:hypothetical protein n=1 Tax=Psychrobacillus sp. L3 TaxID=3236891 RepID=UPI0036F30317